MKDAGLFLAGALVGGWSYFFIAAVFQYKRSKDALAIEMEETKRRLSRIEISIDSLKSWRDLEQDSQLDSKVQEALAKRDN